ncbi:MAG: hypothetical protein E7552_07705, partial [Ruminococcaceae bacterium]|nr:hypothetical protein [Oscillospiraceae bacterium]
MKRTVSIFLAAVLLLAMIPAGVVKFDFAAKAETTYYQEGIFHYTVTEGEATLAYAEMDSTPHVEIPATLGGYPVVAINGLSNALAYTVSIPPSVRRIGRGVFDELYGLKTVYISDLAAWCAIDFGDNPLSDAESFVVNGKKVTDLVIPKGVTVISGGAFSGFDALTSVTIPDSVTSIGDTAFYNCKALQSVTMGNNVQSIGTYAFSGCAVLQNIALDSVQTIGKRAFFECTGLKTATFGNRLFSLGDYAFYGCFNLQSVTLPDSVQDMGLHTFSESGLQSVTLGNGVQNVGEYTFYNCSSLQNVTFGNKIQSIGYRAFEGCYKLTEITLPDTVKTIGGSAFNGCSSLVKADLGDGVTSIGSYAFNTCSGLAEVTVPDGVKVFEDYVFYKCSALKTVNIPQGTTTIGNRVFAHCNALSVNIPASVTSIGEYAFYQCSSLTAITIPASVKTVGKYAFAYCSKANTLTIANGVTEIGEYAFRDCDALVTVTVPDSVTLLGAGALAYCNALQSVTLSKKLTAIYSELFRADTALTSIILPDGVKSTGVRAFYGCTGLTSIRIPLSFTTVGTASFYNCSALKTVYYAGDETDRAAINVSATNDALINAAWDYAKYSVYEYTVTNDKATITDVSTAIEGVITVPTILGGYPVTAIGDSAFRNCVNITEVIIPAGITSIGNYAFRNCTALQAVHYNAADCAKVGLAQYPAFADCPQLSTVYVGKEVTQLPANTFRDAAGLTTVYITKNTKTIYANAFHQTAVTDVYYVGTASDSAAVDVRSYNTLFKDAVFGYNTPCFQAHDWSAACDEVCDVCNVKRAVTHTKIVTDAAVAPTCDKSGLTTGRHCTACGNVIEAQRFVPANGHTWNEGTVLVAPTANKNGSKKYTCTVCGDTKTVVLTLAEIRDGRYYYNGKITAEAGLVQVEDAYYYVGSGGLVKTGRYMVSNVNSLPFSRGIYYFFADGRMNTAAGVYEGYYFNENGKLTPYAGLIEWNAAKYYVNNGGAVNAGGFFYISKLNGLLP